MRSARLYTSLNSTIAYQVPLVHSFKKEMKITFHCAIT